MSSALTPFLIGEIKTGLSTYLQPWQRTSDAFEPLINANIYRGTINKRNGYSLFGTLADEQPVMGIMLWMDESTGVNTLVVASTQNVYYYNTSSSTFDPLVTVGGANSVFWSGAVTSATTAVPSSGTVPTFWKDSVLVPGTVTITAYNGSSSVGVTTDNGLGVFPIGTGIFTGTGTIDYATGKVSFTVTIGSSYTLSLSIAATLVTPIPSSTGYFTGNNTNFFNWTNWQPTEPTTFVSSVSYLYMTNNVDPITLFDGVNLSRPIFYINSAMTDYITTTLDIKVYKNRLLFLRPTLFTTTNALNQSVYYSALFNPFNFINDVAGNGGQLTAATGGIIQASKFLRDALVIMFSNSTWLFRFTGFDISPYRFDKINNSKNNQVPYGTIGYDERITSLGSNGFIACDGSNVQRYDIPIIDYYETEISEMYYSQCFAQRYDNLNQAWMLYVSNGTINPVVGSGAPGSDSAIVYNFLENTWCTYSFTDPMMCLGLYNNQTGLDWEDADFSWESADVSWKAYTNQEASPILLAGDTTGNIYQMDDEDTATDNGTLISAEVTTTRWNPIMQVGQKVQFPYIDIYYEIVSTDPTNPQILTLTFYPDNSQNPAIMRTFTMDGPVGATSAWKRVYINIIAEFLQMEITTDGTAPFKILGFILWAKPSGRLTP